MHDGRCSCVPGPRIDLAALRSNPSPVAHSLRSAGLLAYNLPAVRVVEGHRVANRAAAFATGCSDDRLRWHDAGWRSPDCDRQDTRAGAGLMLQIKGRISTRGAAPGPRHHRVETTHRKSGHSWDSGLAALKILDRKVLNMTIEDAIPLILMAAIITGLIVWAIAFLAVCHMIGRTLKCLFKPRKNRRHGRPERPLYRRINTRH